MWIIYLFLIPSPVLCCDACRPTSKEDTEERRNTVDEQSANAGWNVVPVLFQETASVILHLYKPGNHYSYSNIYIVLQVNISFLPSPCLLFYLSSIVHDSKERAMAPDHLKVGVGFEFAVQLVYQVSICGLRLGKKKNP